MHSYDASRQTDASKATIAPPDPLTEPAQRALQRAVSQRAQAADVRAAAQSEESVHHAAASGTRGAGGPLPHLAQIQASFGRHDIQGVRAHVGGDARRAAATIGAEAYATGQDVAFRQSPSLHLAAHEAAHVVQQRGGVQLKGGVGQAGDPHERHADAVADAVVAGRSAEGLLDQYGGGSGSRAAVQRQEATDAKTPETKPTRDVGALAETVLTAIAEKETGQKAVESRMDTSAGVKASYPSQVQATVGWTLTTLKKLSPEKREAFGVTLKDLTAAEKRAKAAGQLWGAVMKSGGTKSADVKKDAAVKKALAASGLKDADLDQMIAFRDLRGVMDETADAELAKAEEAKGEPLTRAEREKVYRAVGKTVAADDANDSIKMGHVSIRSHIRQDKEPKRSPMWREDMAGWQRKAVESGAKGAEIKKAATADSGLELGRARISEVVRSYVEANPEATDEEVVKHAAKLHNPGSRNYRRDVVKIWQEQSKARAEADKAKAAEGGGAATTSPSETGGSE